MKKITRTSQPQTLSDIDRGNPLANGLLRLYDMSREGSGIDVIASTIPSTETTTTDFRSSGKARAVDGTKYGVWNDDSYRTLISNQLTWFWHGKISTTGNGFICGNGDPSGTGYNHMLYVGSAGLPIFFVKVAGTGYLATGTTTINAATGEYTIVGTYDGVNIKIYFRGVLEGTTARTGNVDTTAFDTLLNRWNLTSAQTGYCYQFGVSNRAWDANEVLNFELNPWQLFAPTKRIFSDVPGAAAANYNRQYSMVFG